MEFPSTPPDRSDRVEGVGLGLSLSREIFRAHGGDMLFEPAGEPLTVFVASLPATREGPSAK